MIDPSLERNALGKTLAVVVLVATGIWLGRIYTGSASYCPVAMLTGRCPFASTPAK